jgi:urease accessory protein
MRACQEAAHGATLPPVLRQEHGRPEGAIALSQTALWRLLILSDSALPTGSFCHSYGLEAWLAGGVAHGVEELRALLVALVREGLGGGEGPAFVLAYRAARAGRLQEALGLDQEALAMRLPAEWRRASVATGRRVLAIGTCLWPSPFLLAYGQAVERGQASGTQPVAAAVVYQAAGIPLQPALLSYLYSAVQGLVSAAVRLVPLGQTLGLKLSALLAPEVEGAARRALATRREEMGSFLPELEIMGMQHERLPMRLFVS